MPNIIITFSESATEQQIKDAKDKLIDQGGEITQEYSIIKGFAATVPDSFASSSFQGLQGVENIEADQVVTTQ